MGTMATRPTVPGYRVRASTPAPVALVQTEPDLDFVKFARQLPQARFAQVFPFFFLVGEDERIKPRTTIRTAVIDVGTLPRMQAPLHTADAQLKPPLVVPLERAHLGGIERLEIGRLPEANICIDDALVSRMHAHIEFRAELIMLIDAGSSNGTFLDDQKLVAYREELLMPGARVKFGAIELRFLSAADTWSWLRVRR